MKTSICKNCGEEFEHNGKIPPNYCQKEECQKQKRDNQINYMRNWAKENYTPVTNKCSNPPVIRIKGKNYKEFYSKDKKKNWSEWTPKHI